MKNLKFNYDLELEFDKPIKEHHFTVKCMPKSNERQEITELNMKITPNNFLSESMDSFGNGCVFGYLSSEHQLFSIHIDGTARCGLSDYVMSEKPYMSMVYKYQTDITRPGCAIKKFYESLDLSGKSILEKAEYIMHKLYEKMKYVPGATDITSSAEEAMKKEQGVCQDYAHIFISLCRIEKIPCRYVVGFLVGEGASHAWCEVFDGQKLYGFDPTNNRLVSDEHISVSSGRDYSDCLINMGVFLGDAKQIQHIRTVVEEI